jgi:hypothetical protein
MCTMEDLINKVHENGMAYVPIELMEMIDFDTITKEHWETYCFDDA